jgi:D-tyrosyl-tRNA(Tyr) deacylase
MKAVIQRVRQAKVSVDNTTVGSIGSGLVVLLGFGRQDGPDLPASLCWKTFLNKIVNLRIFPDEKGFFNESLLQAGGEILLISQFTLYADCRKGRRPSFADAGRPETARELYDRFVADLKILCPALKTGIFGADMDVALCNWGPVTICLDSRELCPVSDCS